MPAKPYIFKKREGCPKMQKLVGITPGPPDAEEDERGLPRRKAATTIDTATAEEDVEDFDGA